jgi:hypothetical protein
MGSGNKLSEIETVLKSYLETTDTDYAYMISAPWGSGKTFFIQNWTEPLHQSIYYSLNGAVSIESVLQAIYLSILTNDKINSKNEKLITKFKTIAEQLGSIVNDKFGTITQLLRTVSMEAISTIVGKKELNDILIVFDDLERISDSINITDLLGEIYMKLIESGVKVIFVCDESKILEQRTDKDAYKIEKEKYIRRTINFVSDKNEILKKLVEDKKFYNDSKEEDRSFYLEALVFFYQSKNQLNFRNIKFVLDIFQEVFLQYHGLQPEENRIPCRQLFYSILVLADLYKAGNMEEEKILSNDYLSQYSLKKIATSGTDKEAEKKIAEDPYYQAKLVCNHFYEPAPILSSIVQLVYRGTFNTDQFEKDVIDEKKDPLYLINNYMDFELAELQEKLTAINENLVNKKYTLKEYRDLTQKFLPLAKKFLPTYDDAKMKKNIFISIKEHPDVFPVNAENDIFEFGNFQDERDLLKEIPELQEFYCKEITKGKNNYWQNFISDLSKDKKTVYRICAKNNNLFSALQAENLFPTLLNQSNKGIRVFSYLIERYIPRVTSANEIYQTQIPALQELSLLIEEKIKTVDNLKKEVLTELDDYVQKAIAHLKKPEKI